MNNFGLNIFSQYRAELMGVATFMILLCHLPAQGVVMPPMMARIIGSGGTGCDVFLFLSGMGMWHSMKYVRSGEMKIWEWYRKRYIRIIVPYILIVVPVCIQNGNDFFSIIIHATGFDFFVYRLALWFVSCILVLYILTPLLDKLLISDKKWVWVIVLTVLCLAFAYPDFGDDYILGNWQFVVGRFPSYFIGYALAKDIKDDRKIPLSWMTVIPIIFYICLYILNHKFGCNFNLFWLQGIPIATIAVLVLSKLNWDRLNSILIFVGVISLESYATNVLVLPQMKSWTWSLAGINLNPGNWTFYIIGTCICLAISWLVNRVSKKIISKFL